MTTVVEMREQGAPADVWGLLERARELVPALETVRPHLWRLGEGDLAGAVEALGDLVRAAEVAMTGLTAEAVGRGTVQASRAASPADWVRRQGGVVEPGRARSVAVVAEASLEPGTASLQQAVWGGGVSVDHAAVALEESAKVLPLLPGADRSEVLGHYLVRASAADASRRELRRLTREIMARYGDDRLDDLDARAKECSGLTERALPTGLVRFQLDLNQPDAARVRAAVDGLSGPRSERGPDGEPVRDPRSPARRRADALLELVERAQASDDDPTAGGCGLSGSTTLVVTMTAEGLAERLREVGARRTGWARGVEELTDDGAVTFGVTPLGDVLTAAQLRQAACDAGIVPMVLGADGTPLETGRAKRLATDAQRATLLVRDGGCTFPGCTRPPGWCHAHHVRHWADGGPTDVDNLALLCERHHTVVHRDGLTARRVGGRWEWEEPP